MFKKIDPQLDLPKLEEEILKFWDENKIFEKSLEIRKDAPLYTFYDGPPFATGTPHYGHIVASLMKDVVPRYWTMKGRLVERKWGWDCHGLPIENLAEKELGIKTKKEIEKMGVDKFNEFCRSKVLGYVDEWKKVIHRLGRWADMDNAYMTMDLSYMESVWWVFKQLWDKGLIYEGYRSMHICPRCETTLSQYEVTEGYQNIKDLSLTAEFKLADEPDTSILAWTTTPWTLIGNVALAVGDDIDYLEFSVKNYPGISDGVYITSKQDFSNYKKEIEEKSKGNNAEVKILREFKGKKLVGKKYIPLFDYYSSDKKLKNHENGWKIVSADFVTTEDGTGIVHIAPAFGEEDMELGREKNLPFIQHVGMDGIIKKEAGEFSGLSVKPKDDLQATDKKIIKYLEEKNLLFLQEEYTHSYPHCWRCETPLINYATSSWFVAVEKVKPEAIKSAKEINWFPKHIKRGRFGKWLEGARDWSISRQRYWASVMPIWRCGKCKELKVFGSVAELEKASDQKVTDLHKHIIDKVTFKCCKCKGEMKRVPDVLDTWFDSGSMPYAQMHYPFENKNKFETNFPAEFIAEGSDQTRAWFYYLHILATAVMQKPAYKNVIVNGIVLAEDGKKMSKRLKNYPDPMEVFDKYGADVLRFYLLSSPVMAAENLSLSEKELVEIQRGMFRMLWNSYYFFILYANVDGWQPKKSNEIKPKNLLDRWIISRVEKLNLDLDKSMTNYDLVTSARLLPEFVDDLSNWYIRRSRKRFWKSENDEDKKDAYATLHYVLMKLSKLLAPFTPFIAEEIYKNLANEESVHSANFPEAQGNLIDSNLIAEMSRARKIVEQGLAKRAEAKIRVRQPLGSLSYHGKKLDKELESIIADEVNVKKVVNDEKAKEGIVLDTKITADLIAGGQEREMIRAIQSLRKKADFEVDDRIETYYSTDSKQLQGVFTGEHLKNILRDTLTAEIEDKKDDSIETSGSFNIDGENIWLGVRRKK